MPESPTSLVLLHGFASSFDHGWRQSGWVDILGDFDCEVPEIDLPGHGSSARLTDPQDYAEVEKEVLGLLPPGTRHAVGFSAGGDLLLRMAIANPGRFERIAVLGVGDNVLDDGDPATIVDALEGDDEPEDVQARLFRRLARTTGNDAKALSAFIRRPRPPLSEKDLSTLSCPVLVVLGDRDMVGPADRLVAALPQGSLVTLAGVDHFSTPSDFGAIDATMRFFGMG
ncbi:MAG TPA: alpha/beta hydrolase [Acidimicrobiales bacterium]|nr:alpha/beta hydrolase [Acidimicrobiales bacterium]